MGVYVLDKTMLYLFYFYINTYVFYFILFAFPCNFYVFIGPLQVKNQPHDELANMSIFFLKLAWSQTGKL